MDTHSEDRLKDQEHAGRRPCLRMAGDRIRHRTKVRFAMKTAEQLGQAAAAETDRRIEQAFEDANYPGAITTAREPQRSDRVVMGPHRAVVITHRIIAALGIAERPDAPPREHVAAQQSLGELLAMSAVDDS